MDDLLWLMSQDKVTRRQADMERAHWLAQMRAAEQGGPSRAAIVLTVLTVISVMLWLIVGA